MFILFIVQEFLNFQNISRLKKANKEKSFIEKKLSDSNVLLQQAEAERSLLEAEAFAVRHQLETVENTTAPNESILKVIKEKEAALEEARSKIESIEEDNINYLYSLDEKEELIRKLLGRIPAQEVVEVAENDNEKLNRLRRLWVDNNLSWDDRLQIESEVSLAKLGRTPFTDYVAYVSIERWITLSCQAYSLINPSRKNSLQEQIDILKENKIITREEATFLHESRIARNKWFHGDKQPAPELTSKVIKFLKHKHRPKILPRV